MWCVWLCSQKPPNTWKRTLVYVVATLQVTEGKKSGGEWYVATDSFPLPFSGTNVTRLTCSYLTYTRWLLFYMSKMMLKKMVESLFDLLSCFLSLKLVLLL